MGERAKGENGRKGERAVTSENRERFFLAFRHFPVRPFAHSPIRRFAFPGVDGVVR
jgi:hypothetical protein